MYKFEKSHQSTKDRYNHFHHEYDPKNPTFSSSSLEQINKSLKTQPKTEQHQNRGRAFEEEKMSSLRRACLVEKWMEKEVNEKIISHGKNTKSKSLSSTPRKTKKTTLMDEFDVQDRMFFSTTTTTTTTTTSETEYSVFVKPRAPHCLGPPPRPKPVKTRAIESRYLDQLDQNKDEVFVRTRSRAQKMYSNINKSFKQQPISPGARLSSFISSLFVKDGKNSKATNKSKSKDCKSEVTSPTTCSSATSFSRSCLSRNSSPTSRKNNGNNKRTVRFCPVSVIVDEDSRPCGEKSLFEEREKNSKLARSISKRYEELRKLNEQKQLEEVALDLLNGYWDSRLINKSHDQNITTKDKVSNIVDNDHDDDSRYYGANHGGNYDRNDDVYVHEEDDDDDDDGLSCSSSDLFELDLNHLSLIENELPVYETTLPKFL